MDFGVLGRSDASKDKTNFNNSSGSSYTLHDQVNRMGILANEVEGTLAFDRAFLYVIRHNPTGLILYIGRYLDPETY